MKDPKDVNFTEKKVDENWKEDSKGQKDVSPQPEAAANAPKLNFSVFLTSLGFQALIHLGELEHPETKKKEKNLNVASETIDLLLLMKEKTKGNLSSDEEKLLEILVSDLQMKYVKAAS